MDSIIRRAAEARDNEAEVLEIIKVGLNFYSEKLRAMWNEAPQGDKALVLFAMETMAALIRETWPDDGRIADVLGGLFSGMIVAGTAPRKENEK